MYNRQILTMLFASQEAAKIASAIDSQLFQLSPQVRTVVMSVDGNDSEKVLDFLKKTYSSGFSDATMIIVHCGKEKDGNALSVIDEYLAQSETRPPVVRLMNVFGFDSDGLVSKDSLDAGQILSTLVKQTLMLSSDLPPYAQAGYGMSSHDNTAHMRFGLAMEGVRNSLLHAHNAINTAMRAASQIDPRGLSPEHMQRLMMSSPQMRGYGAGMPDPRQQFGYSAFGNFNPGFMPPGAGFGGYRGFNENGFGQDLSQDRFAGVGVWKLNIDPSRPKFINFYPVSEQTHQALLNYLDQHRQSILANPALKDVQWKVNPVGEVNTDPSGIDEDTIVYHIPIVADKLRDNPDSDPTDIYIKLGEMGIRTLDIMPMTLEELYHQGFSGQPFGRYGDEPNYPSGFARPQYARGYGAAEDRPMASPPPAKLSPGLMNFYPINDAMHAAISKYFEQHAGEFSQMPAFKDVVWRIHSVGEFEASTGMFPSITHWVVVEGDSDRFGQVPRAVYELHKRRLPYHVVSVKQLHMFFGGSVADLA